MRNGIYLVLGLFCLGLNAQTMADVVRLGTEESQGTARYQAMGGAFGALGGDLSSLNVNPAGSAVFNYGQFSITGSNYNRDNEQLYGNTFNNASLNSTELNQVGGVFVFEGKGSNWKKLALAINYDLVDNFDNYYEFRGATTSGLDNYFLNYADGIPFNSILRGENEYVEIGYLRTGEDFGYAAQQAYLGYYGGLIDPADPENEDGTSYISTANYDQVNQRYRQTTNGYNSKFTVNMAGQYQENLYLGASLNFHSIFYERLSLLDEDGYADDSQITFATFDNLLQTEGNGFSFSLGAIAKLNENIRIGGSYQSPTWYYLTDNASQRINSSSADENIGFLDFDEINYYPDYTIKTPGKVSGSAAIIFAKEGLLSFDYGYQDFSNARLRPENDIEFSNTNQAISSELQAVNTYRIGGEYRIERLSLRGGYRIEESPYVDKTILDDLTGYSAGIGYDFGGSKLDAAFVRTEQDTNFRLYDAGLGNSAASTFINTNVTLTYTLKF
ncbi:OmpP1/FadL family transporter [Croceivirga radicis]|uniref:OmpP1/FadL family transporter n=1 Tax=Croceivirga radicis TaxID=1929488 RepID=UPI000255AAE8|nr:outer membrane protein transport protein [Croceivirga radicis]